MRTWQAGVSGTHNIIQFLTWFLCLLQASKVDMYEKEILRYKERLNELEFYKARTEVSYCSHSSQQKSVTVATAVRTEVS